MSLLACAPDAWAQSSPAVSRPVVQALPSATSQRLNAALARLARDPRDVAALIDAGDAANAMGDPEAAAGFYTRAEAISPNNARVTAGHARALVLQGNPTKAIPLFAAAEASGATMDVTADRGLAYDLVGDTTTAQTYYRAALARKDDDETRRRLGVSLAISGDAKASDEMLLPLLRKQDKPGWRSQAFALAIAGKTKEAVDTVNAILPPQLAQSVTPYLRYMPRLTRAQQAAAANLGKFPRASEIGQDDPAIAAFAASAPRLAAADAGLIPRGKALGGSRARSDAAQPAPLTRSQRRARDKAARLARAEANAAARVAPPEPMPAIGRSDDGELPALASSAAPVAATAGPVATASSIRTPVAAGRVARAASAPRQPTPAPAPALAAAVPTRTTPREVPPRAPSQPSASVPNASLAAPASAIAGFDLARQSGSTAVPSLATLDPAARAPTAAASTQALASAPPPSSAPPSTSSAGGAAPAVPLEQIFADLGAPSRAPAPVAGAVDVRTIAPIKLPPALALAKVEAKPGEAAKPTSEKAGGKATNTQAAKKAADLRAAEAKAADAKAAALKSAGTADAANGKKPDTKGKKADPKKPDPKEKTKKAPPSHPSRIWVQIGVGRDKAAIGFDWRKFVKASPALFKGRQAFISDMGRTNRILVGPFETQKAAAAFQAQARKAEFGGAFVWTSPAGQVVDALAGK